MCIWRNAFRRNYLHSAAFSQQFYLKIISINVNLEFSWTVAHQKRVYHRVTIPLYKKSYYWSKLLTSIIIVYYHYIKKRGLFKFVTKAREVRKHFTILDKIMRQLIFYNIISIIVGHQSLKGWVMSSFWGILNICFYNNEILMWFSEFIKTSVWRYPYSLSFNSLLCCKTSTTISKLYHSKISK